MVGTAHDDILDQPGEAFWQLPDVFLEPAPLIRGERGPSNPSTASTISSSAFLTSAAKRDVLESRLDPSPSQRRIRDAFYSVYGANSHHQEVAIVALGR